MTRTCCGLMIDGIQSVEHYGVLEVVGDAMALMATILLLSRGQCHLVVVSHCGLLLAAMLHYLIALSHFPDYCMLLVAFCYVWTG